MTTTRSSSPLLFKTTQSRKNIELLEDYVEAINEILNTKGSVKNVDLCKYFGVSNATVSKNIKRGMEHHISKETLNMMKKFNNTN